MTMTMTMRQGADSVARDKKKIEKNMRQFIIITRMVANERTPGSRRLRIKCNLFRLYLLFFLAFVFVLAQPRNGWAKHVRQSVCDVIHFNPDIVLNFVSPSFSPSFSFYLEFYRYILLVVFRVTTIFFRIHLSYFGCVVSLSIISRRSSVCHHFSSIRSVQRTNRCQLKWIQNSDGRSTTRP